MIKEEKCGLDVHILPELYSSGPNDSCTKKWRIPRESMTYSCLTDLAVLDQKHKISCKLSLLYEIICVFFKKQVSNHVTLAATCFIPATLSCKTLTVQIHSPLMVIQFKRAKSSAVVLQLLLFSSFHIQS